MPASKLTIRLFWAAEVLLLGGAIFAAAQLSTPDEWHPFALVALLLMLTLLGQWFTVETSSGILSASFVAIMLAMSLLGPVPAAACGTITAVLHSAVGRRQPARWLNNLLAFAVVGFVGGLMVRALAGNVHDPRNQHLTHGIMFGLIVLGVFMVTTGLNFIPVALDVRVEEGRALARQVRELFLPLLPGQLAAGMLATILAVAYMSLGLPMLVGAIAVLLILQHLTVALLRSEDRAEQLEIRSRQLSSFQGGCPPCSWRASGCATPRHCATRPRLPATQKPWQLSWAVARTSRNSSTSRACSTTSASSRGPTVFCIPSS